MLALDRDGVGGGFEGGVGPSLLGVGALLLALLGLGEGGCGSDLVEGPGLAGLLLLQLLESCLETKTARAPEALDAASRADLILSSASALETEQVDSLSTRLSVAGSEGSAGSVGSADSSSWNS